MQQFLNDFITTTMKKKAIYTIIIAAFALANSLQLYAQLPEGTSERYIRIAEIGELADSINVLGDVTSAGRYLVPEDTNLPELLAFSFGYTPTRGLDSDIDWTKTVIQLKVSRYSMSSRKVEVALFKYRYNKPEPAEMFEFDLQNNDLVTLQVRRKPSFGDYVKVVAPVIGVIATSVLLVENLRQ
jgi:hypothetical protein